MPCLDRWGQELGVTSALRKAVNAGNLGLVQRILPYTNRENVRNDYLKKTREHATFIRTNEQIATILLFGD